MGPVQKNQSTSAELFDRAETDQAIAVAAAVIAAIEALDRESP